MKAAFPLSSSYNSDWRLEDFEVKSVALLDNSAFPALAGCVVKTPIKDSSSYSLHLPSIITRVIRISRSALKPIAWIRKKVSKEALYGRGGTNPPHYRIA